MPTSQILQQLYSINASSPDFLRYLYYLIQDDDEEQYLTNLQGTELTQLVDFLDKALDVTPITDDVSRRCLHKLQAICGHQTVLPSSYNVSGDISRVGSDPVATGGFSDVWEGIYDSRKVCIKSLRITRQSRQAIEKGFCKEAVMWKRLRHPNIVAFIGITRDPLQFVSEWMPNGTLTDYIGKNPDVNRIGLLLDIAEGLTFLHANYTTHGDLKGPNVLIDQSGHARLTDFGFASVVRGLESIHVTQVQGYTPRWAAPEVLWDGDRNTREADVFAFAMVTVEVFTGRHPFSEFSAPVTISKIMSGERPNRPREPALTDSVWDMTLCCWHQDPDQRPAMKKVVGDLRECSRLNTVNPHPSPQAEQSAYRIDILGSALTGGKPTLIGSPDTGDDATPSQFSLADGKKTSASSNSSHDQVLSESLAVLDVTEHPGKAELGVASAQRDAELQGYITNLVYKDGEVIDMDLLNENRSLVHTGKFLRQDEKAFEGNGWTELFALLFDNYLVMTKPEHKGGVTKYYVYQRPILLDLLTLVTFADPPTRRDGGFLPPDGEEADGRSQNYNSPTPDADPDSANHNRTVYPCMIHHGGRFGGLFALFVESEQARLEWKFKLEKAMRLRKGVQESSKPFEVETLSVDTFFLPALVENARSSWNDDRFFTGEVTCSVPFVTPDGRGLVAIGCAEGVWIGFRHDSRSMRRVLHLRMVTQCAMLEDFGIFLVLADKSLFAYHIEALAPSSPGAVNASQTPQKLSGNKDVQFFTVGNLGGRTLVIYMKKKNLDSVFRVLEPVIGKINEKSKPQPSIGSRFGLRSQRSEWFRVCRDFFLPSDSYDLLFLKARIVILCSKGFEIMDLSDFKSVTIPQKEDPRLERLAKRTESCRPMGMFRSNKDEFLLCYDEFGLYIDEHGDPSRRMGTIEWEGTAERVAWHAPYIILFNSRFIEIRHVVTGRLVQIISGNDMRCIWDGRGTNRSRAVSEGPWDEVVSQEPMVHGVMNLAAPQAGRRGPTTTQRVFGLIPAAPSLLPGPLASPSHLNQSNSPPHPPNLNPAHSFQ